jgi:hypothetical protein
MIFSTIKKLSGDNQNLEKTLVYGYLSSLSDRELLEKLRADTLDPIHRDYILNCLLGYSRKFCLYDELAALLIKKFMQTEIYKTQKTLAYRLSHIFDHCSDAQKKEVVVLFLSSQKKAFQNYLFKKDLSFLDNHLFEMVLELADKNKKLGILIDTVSKYYKKEDFVEDFIRRKFQWLLDKEDLEDWSIRQIFSRSASISKKHMEWLRNKFPDSFIYICSIKNLPVPEEECINIYKKTSKDPFSSTDTIRFLLKSFSRMQKWEAIEKSLLYYSPFEEVPAKEEVMEQLE